MTATINANLYAHQRPDGTFDRLIMPSDDFDNYGQLTAPEPTGPGWYAVQWPLNPHFTGEDMILERINMLWPNRERIK